MVATTMVSAHNQERTSNDTILKLVGVDCGSFSDVFEQEPTSNKMIKILLAQKERTETNTMQEEQASTGDRSANGSKNESCYHQNDNHHDHIDEKEQDFVALFKRKGNFFAVAFIPLALFGVLAVFNHLVTYLYTDSWNRTASALALGVCEDPSNHETKTTKAVIDAHALMGITVVAAVAIQVWTGNMMHFHHRGGKEGSSSRSLSNLIIQAHKKLGLLIVVVWIACAILGIIFTFVSGHWDYMYDYQYSLSRIVALVVIFGLIGIATVTNIFLGAKSVLFLDKKVGSYRRNLQLFEHKGLMCFGVFWISGSALDECLMSVVQLIVHDCYIETFGMVACSAIGQTLQVLAIVLGAYRYEKSLIFDHAFVRVNILLLIFRTSVLWASFIYLLASDYSEFTLEGTPSCFEV